MSQRKMRPPRRVRVVESHYIEESDLIRWKLLFLDDGMDQIYVWPSVDLLKLLNITRTEVDPSLLHKFCRDMTNKEINFVIDEEPDLPSPEITQEQANDLQDKLRDHFDTFKKIVEEES